MIEKLPIDKLYNLIIRLISLLEEEVDSVDSSKARKSTKGKKAITDLLGKLVTVIIQLSKLDKDKLNNDELITTFEDQQIIEAFIKKSKRKN